MAQSDGAVSSPVSDDSVLTSALSAMEAEGTITANAGMGDLDTESTASQPSSPASAGTTPSAPTAPAGDDGAPGGTITDPATPVVADDPLAGTEPFTYGADKKALEGVYRVPGEGLLVPEDKRHVIEQLAERADALDRSSRQLTEQLAPYERLATWKTTGADGKEATLTGVDALKGLHSDNARLSSILATIEATLTDPQALRSLLTLNEQKAVVFEPQAFENLLLRAERAAHDAMRVKDTELGTLLRPSPTSTTASTPDYSASAPALIKQSAGTNFEALTAKDQELLTRGLQRFVRPATAEDVRYNTSLKVGAPIVDAEYAVWVQHMAAGRAESKAQAQAAEKAGKVNAGMDKGRQPVKQPAKPATPPAAPKKPNERQRPDWDTPLTNALQEMGIER